VERSSPGKGKVDVDRPSSARIYDYFLGGAHNFEVDRKAADELAQVHPAIARAMRANRSYLRRAVSYLAEAGIDQFLDLGSGIPTVGNVHEIAQRINPQAKVVYVDIEPIAVTHSNTILAGNERAVAVLADLCDPAAVLADPDVQALLDLSRPVALICAGVLQYISDEENPAGVIAGYRDRLAPGSYVAMSHPSMDDLTPERSAGATAVTSVYERTPTPFTFRTQETFESYFSGFDLVEPGVVRLWRWGAVPDEVENDLEGQVSGLAGVARKP
jgi:O-methyltransferase involved in polyketide biosynthesis